MAETNDLKSFHSEGSAKMNERVGGHPHCDRVTVLTECTAGKWSEFEFVEMRVKRAVTC